MDPALVQDLPAAQLARMLDPSALPGWNDAEGAAVLRHQLAAPLLPDLASAPGAEISRLQALVNHRDNAGSFLKQLTSPRPSVELLEAIKRFARHVRDDIASPLHGGPAIVLYYAAIAAALVRCKVRVTQLSDAQMTAGFTWAMAQPATESLTLLFQLANAEITSRAGEPL